MKQERLMKEQIDENVPNVPVDESEPLKGCCCMQDQMASKDQIKLGSDENIKTCEVLKPLDLVSNSGRVQPGKEKAEREEIRTKADNLFRSGYTCSEAISIALLETFATETHREAIRCASAFGGGIGGMFEDLCGAFTGGVLTLGYLLGREKPGESLRICGILIKEFKREFLTEFGSLNCSAILKKLAIQDCSVVKGCDQLTAHSAQMLADLLIKAEKERKIDLETFLSLPRERVEMGRCPFGACK